MRDFRAWVHDVTAKRLESHGYMLSPKAVKYLLGGWAPALERLESDDFGEDFFERQHARLWRYLTLAADLMVHAAAELGNAQIGPEEVRRGTNAMFDLKNKTPLCNHIGEFPEVKEFFAEEKEPRRLAAV